MSPARAGRCVGARQGFRWRFGSAATSFRQMWERHPEETPRCARDPEERDPNSLLAPPEGLRATDFLAAHFSQQVGVDFLRIVSETALLHRLVRTHAVLQKSLIALHGLDLAFERAQHEGVRRFSESSSNALDTRFQTTWQL